MRSRPNRHIGGLSAAPATVYFRSNGGQRKLPDVVLSLDGQFHIGQVGFIDSKRGGVRTRFTSVPDASLDQVAITLSAVRMGYLKARPTSVRTHRRLGSRSCF